MADDETPKQNDGVLLFIGNVPWASTAEDVTEELMQKSGIKCDVRISVKKTGRSRGYATVRVPQDDAEKLIGLSEKIVLEGRPLKIDRRRRRRERRNKKQDGEGGDEVKNNTKQQEKKSGVLLFIGNVPWETKSEKINAEIKEKTGIVADCRVSRRQNGRSRGYATVRVAAEDAVKLTELSEKGFEIGGRPLRIEEKKRRGRKPRKKAAEATQEGGEAAEPDRVAE